VIAAKKLLQLFQNLKTDIPKAADVFLENFALRVWVLELTVGQARLNMLRGKTCTLDVVATLITLVAE